MNKHQAQIALNQAQKSDPYGKIKAKLLSGIPSVKRAIEVIKEEKRIKEKQLLQYWKDYHQEHKEYRKREYRKKNPFKSKDHERQGSNRDTYYILKPKYEIKKITITKIGGN